MTDFTVTQGWIGVDLDGTLAFYNEGHFPDIGPPLSAMVDRVRDWLAAGKDVRIFTARVAVTGAETYAPFKMTAAEFHTDQVRRIEEWCATFLGVVLPITCQKDFCMLELWDDRCVQMITNTGRSLRDEVQDKIIDAIDRTIDSHSDRL